MKKIKIFLGGYINKQNAQNLNCLALAEYFNKEKFEIYTMKTTDGNINIDHIEKTCNVLSYNEKLKFTKKWKYIYALYKCDILYLPKQEKLEKIIYLNKLFFKKKLFLTIESIIDDYIISVINKNNNNSLNNYLRRVNNIDYIYSISKYIKEYNELNVKLKSKNTILHLGVNSNNFVPKEIKIKPIKNIIFIGNDMLRKGIYEYIKLANKYSNITFHIVGTGHDINLKEIVLENSNIKCHGSVNIKELNIILQNIDLHILPSKSEGFPKVILETASVGVASLIYSNYGANDWITHNKDGFVVDNYDELEAILEELVHNEQLLYEVSKNAIKLAEKFDWKNVIKEWEEEIIDIVQERN